MSSVIIPDQDGNSVSSVVSGSVPSVSSVAIEDAGTNNNS